MPPERNDYTPLKDAFTRVIVEVVRFGLEQLEPRLISGHRTGGLLTRKQTATRLAMSLTTLHERRKAGLLVPVDEDGRTVYRIIDVENYERKLRQME